MSPLFQTWNVPVFGLLRGTAESPAMLIQAGKWLAVAPAYLAGLLVLIYIIRRKDAGCAAAVLAGWLATRLVKFLIGVYAYSPRPFEVGFGPSLIEHSASNSMPSSHVTFVWLLAAVCATRGQWRLTSLLFVLGLMVAWARVFVGVHWPADMLGAAIAALVCAMFGAGAARVGASAIGFMRSLRKSDPASRPSDPS
jgi:undecaprenyl-diphosphatase